MAGIAGGYYSPSHFADQMRAAAYGRVLGTFLARYDEELPVVASGGPLWPASFEYSDLKVEGGDTVTTTLTVTNTGERAGADVPQLYLTDERGTTACACSASSAWSCSPGSRAA